MSFSSFWNELRHHPTAQTGGLRLRLERVTPAARVFASSRVDDGRPGILIEFPSPVFRNVRLPPPARRVRVATVQAGSDGVPLGHEALLVELQDAAFADLFERLAHDLAAGIAAAVTVPAAAIVAAGVLDRWFRFMDRAQPLLSDPEVKGLIGELCVLERLASRLGRHAALDGWVSPGGSIRDFEAVDCAIEVKAFSPSQGATVRINDPFQLEPDPGVPMFLVCQELGASGAAEHTLAGHAARVAAIVANDAPATERFGLLLAAAGFPMSDADNALYTRQGWRPGPLHAFRVAADFPRVKPSDVPAGVCAVRFSVEVATLTTWRVDAATLIGPDPSGGGIGNG